MNDAPDDLDRRQKRRARGEAAAEQIHRALKDPMRDLPDRATEGLRLLTDKLTGDVEQQLEHAMASKGANDELADREIARLLRMLDKRKRLFEELQAMISDA
jgi:hypothetical protein